jgi:N6-adenosine-specific RNA methylase IME4
MDAAKSLLAVAGKRRFGTILADPPWQFQNKTGKIAPEHKRLNRYGTMTLKDIEELPVSEIVADPAHLYLWVPNALGFYFRNVTEILLFGTRGKNARTHKLGRTQVNYIATRKREHSRKPDEQYAIIEGCSPGPFLEMFARGARSRWTSWGNQAVESYEPTWKTYAHNSAAERSLAALDVLD